MEYIYINIFPKKQSAAYCQFVLVLYKLKKRFYHQSLFADLYYIKYKAIYLSSWCIYCTLNGHISTGTLMFIFNFFLFLPAVI